jgi:general secretion pathway protein D
VVASPEVQRVYEYLIQKLDKRRPQVMVEVTLVTLDTSDNFSLGVELSKLGDFGSGPSNEYLVFSSFGLSTPDITTGDLILNPGPGVNATLVAPNVLEGVLKALATTGRTEVVSAPKVLVNDNSTATLSSVSESPFTSVNASSTVSTTSFGGYASAGTTITATPHISEGDHLQLEYAITLSSFSGDGSEGVPPPRQTNSISSDVTVPDGYAIIVGGLTRKDISKTDSHVPFLGDIPAFKYIFGARTDNHSQSTLFAFIRPVILRDNLFQDLKYLSEKELKAAQLPGNYPESMCMTMN